MRSFNIGSTKFLRSRQWLTMHSNPCPTYILIKPQSKPEAKNGAQYKRAHSSLFHFERQQFDIIIHTYILLIALHFMHVLNRLFFDGLIRFPVVNVVV